MIKRYEQNEIEELAQILKNDGVISVPTDTVFGICARMNSKLAHDKLVKVKNRDENKAFPIMCANVEQIKSIAILDEKAERLIKAFMPGPITLILKRDSKLPEYVTNGKDTIAVRMASSNVLEELILEAKSPLFMTSANQSGEKECTNLDEIEKECPLLDGMMEGQVHYSKGSTIVDCTSEEFKLLREGPISMEQIDSYNYIGKTVKVKIDRPLNSKHPKHGFIYPVNYGFVPNTISGDGEELDCYVLGIDKPVKDFEGKCIAVIHRTNDNDDKLIIVPEGMNFNDEEIRQLTYFQEQYFESKIIR